MKKTTTSGMELVAASNKESLYRKPGKQEVLIKFSESNEDADQPAVSVLRETEDNPLPVAAQKSDTTEIKIEPSSGSIGFPVDLYPVIRSQQKFTKQRTSDVECSYRRGYQHKYHGVKIATIKSADQLPEENLRDAIEAVVSHHSYELGFRLRTEELDEIVRTVQENGYEEFIVGAYDWDKYDSGTMFEEYHKKGIANGHSVPPSQLKELGNDWGHLVIF